MKLEHIYQEILPNFSKLFENSVKNVNEKLTNTEMKNFFTYKIRETCNDIILVKTQYLLLLHLMSHIINLIRF